MARALPGEFFVVGQPLGRGPRAEADRGLQERAFDEPARAGALPLVEGRKDALDRPHAGAEIADRQTDRGRLAVGLAGHVHDPAHALGDQVKAAAAGMGPVIAETGELRVDQPRIDLVQSLEAELGARHHRRPINFRPSTGPMLGKITKRATRTGCPDALSGRQTPRVSSIAIAEGKPAEAVVEDLERMTA